MKCKGHNILLLMKKLTLFLFIKNKYKKNKLNKNSIFMNFTIMKNFYNLKINCRIVKKIMDCLYFIKLITDLLDKIFKIKMLL